MFTKRHIALRATGTALVAAAAVWASLIPAFASATTAADRAFEPEVWVGSTTLSHVAGEVRPGGVLGINFGVDLSGEDLASLPDIPLTLDLADMAGKVVVTGLTEDCDPTPTRITCLVVPTDTSTHYQSMTLAATASSENGDKATITAYAGESSGESGPATIDLSVVKPVGPPEAGAPATSAATDTAPPVIIAPLPIVPPPGVKPSSSAPAPVVTITAALGQVPQAIGTRVPGFAEVGADGKPLERRSSGSTGPSPVLTVALGASSMGLLALLIFGLVNLRRANRRTRAAGIAPEATPTVPNRPTLGTEWTVPLRRSDPTYPNNPDGPTQPVRRTDAYHRPNGPPDHPHR